MIFIKIKQKEVTIKLLKDHSLVILLPILLITENGNL